MREIRFRAATVRTWRELSCPWKQSAYSPTVDVELIADQASQRSWSDYSPDPKEGESSCLGSWKEGPASKYYSTSTKETRIEPAEGAATFTATGSDYDHFMGRYSAKLARLFADTVDLSPGVQALDLGCGPGALTGVLVERVGSSGVSACDPSPSFVAACASRYPDVDVRAGRAEAIPFEDSGFDVAMAQLVLHFVTEPETATRELRRVVRNGGVVAACVWDFEQRMEMLRAFWDAAALVDPSAPDEATAMRFGRDGEIADLLASSGFVDVTETTLTVSSRYESFDELWSGFLAGIGTAGSFCVSLDEDRRASLRHNLFERIGEPMGSFELSATARSASGVAPD